MILAIDIGNTRTKWGCFDTHGVLVEQGAADNFSIAMLTSTFRQHGDCRRAVVSNVAGEVIGARMAQVLAGLNIPALWIKSQAVACGVSNGYESPETLGTDRWAALIAAWNTHHAPCIVVNAGTAMTVDALSGAGDFLGGLIVPGLGLMRTSLATGTAAVSPALGQWRDFPATTADAVHTGMVSALAGAIRHMSDLLELREGRSPVCLLSGGDAETVASALPLSTTIAPHLVLQGLVLLEKTSV